MSPSISCQTRKEDLTSISMTQAFSKVSIIVYLALTLGPMASFLLSLSSSSVNEQTPVYSSFSNVFLFGILICLITFFYTILFVSESEEKARNRIRSQNYKNHFLPIWRRAESDSNLSTHDAMQESGFVARRYSETLSERRPLLLPLDRQQHLSFSFLKNKFISAPLSLYHFLKEYPRYRLLFLVAFIEQFVIMGVGEVVLLYFMLNPDLHFTKQQNTIYLVAIFIYRFYFVVRPVADSRYC